MWVSVVPYAHVQIDKCQCVRENDHTPTILVYFSLINEGNILQRVPHRNELQTETNCKRVHWPYVIISCTIEYIRKKFWMPRCIWLNFCIVDTSTSLWSQKTTVKKNALYKDWCLKQKGQSSKHSVRIRLCVHTVYLMQTTVFAFWEQLTYV